MKAKKGNLFYYLRFTVSGSFQVTSLERRVLVNLLTHQSTINGGSSYTPTVTQISREISSDISNISKALKTLRARGVLKIKEMRNFGYGKKTPVHIISDEFKKQCDDWIFKTKNSYKKTTSFCPKLQDQVVTDHKREIKKENQLRNTDPRISNFIKG